MKFLSILAATLAANAPFHLKPMLKGNTLITNSHNMRIFEVTLDNELVMSR